jgi:hypothetical protein
MRMRRDEEHHVREIALHVDSRDRDIKKHPSPSEYVVDLPETFRNVLSVELVYATYTKFCNEDYFVMSVAELEPNLVSCSQDALNAFTHLPLTSNTTLNTYNGRTQYRSIKTFLQPCPSITKLTFRMTLNGGAPAPIMDHVLRFEIRCLVSAPPPCRFGGN